MYICVYIYVCGVITSTSKGLKSYVHGLTLLGDDRLETRVNMCTLGIECQVN